MTRCTTSLLIHSVFCLIVVQSNGQITGNLHVKDPKAITITEDKVQMLCGKKWLGLKVIEVRRELNGEREHREGVEFPCDGKYKSYNGINDGTWEVVSNQFIKITRIPPNRNTHYTFIGAYSIYELSDSTLILGQVLTSSGDWVKKFMFTRSEKIYSEHHKPFDYSKYRTEMPQEGKTIKYHANGNVSSIEYHKTSKRKLSKEEIFIGDYASYPTYNVEDSTIIRMIPVGDRINYYPDGKLESIKHYDEGNPIGEWIKYFPDGKVESVERYDNKGKAVGTWMRYFADGRINVVSDREISHYDQYEYKADGSILHVKRTSNQKGSYVIGRKDSISINRVNFFQRSRASTYTNESIQFHNLTDKELKVTLQGNEKLAISSTILTLKPYDSLDFSLRARIPSGESRETLVLTTNEWQYEIKVNTWGYHLCASDFETNGLRVLPTKFYYYKESEDYQLEITNLQNSSKQKTLPFSKQLNAFELKKGKYNLALIGVSKTRNIEIETR